MVTFFESAHSRTRALLSGAAVLAVAALAVAIGLMPSQSQPARAAGGTFAITDVQVVTAQPVPTGDAITFSIDYSCASEACTGVEMFVPLPAGLDPQWVDGAGNTMTTTAETLSITYSDTAPQGFTVVFDDSALVSGATGQLLVTFNTDNYAGMIPDGQLITLEPTFTQGNDTTTNEPIWEVGGTAESTFAATLELALSKQLVGSTEADTDQPVTYEITVCNPNFDVHGDVAATNVVITDTLPTGAVFVSANNGGTEAGGVVTWNLPADVRVDCANPSPAVSVTVEFPGTAFGAANVPNVISEVTNSASVTGAPIGEPTATVTVDGAVTHGFVEDTSTVPLIDLDVSKTVDGDGDGVFAENEPIALDTPFTWQITVTNNGPTDASGVELTDYPPAGVTITAADQAAFDTTTGLWTIGNLAVGESITVNLTAIVTTANEDAFQAGGGIGWAEISAADQDDTDSDPGTNTADGAGLDKGDDGTVEDDEDDAAVTLASTPVIDLDVNKRVDGNADDTFAENEQISLDTPFTWRITVTNDGPDNGSGIEVMDYVPAGLTITAADNTGFDITTGLWTIGNLDAGDSTTVNLTTIVTAADEAAFRTGGGVNWAEVTNADQEDIDSDPGTNTADGTGLDKGTDGPTEDDEDDASVTLEVIQPEPVIDLNINKRVDGDGDGTFSDAESVGPDSPFTWRIIVTNDGPDDATGVELTDYVPAGVTLTASDNADFDVATNIWAIGTLPAGQSVTANVTAVIEAANASAFLAGTGTNWAEISAADQDDIDSDPGTNTADGTGSDKGTDGTVEDDEDQATVTYVAPLIDLDIVKTVDGDGDGVFAKNEPITVDTPFTWQITVTNNGPDDATGVELTDYPPAGVTITAADQAAFNITTGLWTIGDLAVGESITVNLTAIVTAANEEAFQAGGGVGWAEISAADQEDIDSEPGTDTADAVGPDKGADGTAEDDEDNAAVTLASTPAIDLDVNKRVDGNGDGTFAKTEQIETDAPFTWRIIVTNNGPDDATGITARDYVPAGATVTSADHAGYDLTSGIWTIGDISNGDSVTLNLTAIVTAANADAFSAGGGVNWAEVTGADQDDIDSEPGTDTADREGPDKGADGTIEDDEDSATIALVPIPQIDLEINKRIDGNNDGTFADREAIEIDTPYIWRIIVTNNGPDDATGVTVQEYFPAGVTVTGADDAGYDLATGGWTIGALANGASKTVNLTAVVTAANAETFLASDGVNWAEISAAEQEDVDSEPGVNTADGEGADRGEDGQVEDDEDRAIADLEPAAPKVDLTLTKNRLDDLVPNKQARWSLTVTNLGPDTDPGPISVIDNLPPALSAVSAAGGEFSCTIPADRATIDCTRTTPLAVGETATIIITTLVDADVANGTSITNNAVVGSSSVEQTTTNNADTGTGIILRPVGNNLPITGSSAAVLLTMVGAALLAWGTNLKFGSNRI